MAKKNKKHRSKSTFKQILEETSKEEPTLPIDELKLSISIYYMMNQPGCIPTGDSSSGKFYLSSIANSLPFRVNMPDPFSRTVEAVVITQIVGKYVKGYVAFVNRTADFEIRPGGNETFGVGFAYYTTGELKIALEWINPDLAGGK